VNDAYLDRNYGGILIVWDRIFGTFQDELEEERCVYGTRGELRSWDPLWANAEVYWALARDSWHARNWADKLRVWLKPPGWRPADVAARFPKPAFDIAQVTRYEPVVPRGVQWFAGVQFLLLLVGVAVFLWFSDAVALPRAAVWLAALTAALWAVGACCRGGCRSPRCCWSRPRRWPRRAPRWTSTGCITCASRWHWPSRSSSRRGARWRAAG
jgi:alkylglycerol monooxygenase